MKKVVKKLTAAFLVSILILVSCEKLNDLNKGDGIVNVYNYDKNQLSMVEFIEKYYGIKRDLISFKEKYVLFDDMCIKEKDLLEMIDQSNDKEECFLGVEDTIVTELEKQRIYINGTVSIAKTSNIKVWVAPSMLAYSNAADWNNMINQAIGEFNVIFQNTNSNLRFIRTNDESTKDIVIAAETDQYYSLPSSSSTASGWAAIPSSGYPGHAITIRQSRVNYDSYNQNSIHLLMHEMMHTIGFAHSNDLVNTDVVPQTSSATNITLPESLAELGNNDILSLMRMYPKTMSTPIWPITNPVVKQSTGTVRLTVKNPTHNTKPYYYIQVIKYNASGTTVLGTKLFKSVQSGTGNQVLVWSGHAVGTYQFAVKGLNFRKDRGTGATSKKIVAL